MVYKLRLQSAKVHTFHGSEVMTAATATEITLNGSKQLFCSYSDIIVLCYGCEISSVNAQ